MEREDQQMPSDSQLYLDQLKSMPGHLIRRLQQHSTAVFSEVMQRYDLTSVQLVALVAIFEAAELDATRLSELIHFDRATIGGVIARLEQKGLIKREVSSVDKRIKILRTTRAGEAMIRLCQEDVERVQGRILSPLSTAEVATFMELTARIIAHPK